jgi:hypothetical protein
MRDTYAFLAGYYEQELRSLIGRERANMIIAAAELAAREHGMGRHQNFETDIDRLEKEIEEA